MISIAIPTFNQSVFLDLFFLKHIQLLKKFNIPIIVSDNASTDDTEMIVRKWQEDFELIIYNRNSQNIGYDKNVLTAFSLSDTRYTWLMGDTYYISSELFKSVLLAIKNDNPDFIVLNLESMVKNIPSQLYFDQNKILSELGGLMTCLSCLIFHKKMIDLDLSNLNISSSFIHLDIIFNYIDLKNFRALWIANESVKSLKHPSITKINWSHKSDVFEVGFKQWVDFIYSLPESYLFENKNTCIRSFGLFSKLGTFRGFLLMRARGQFTFTNYKKYENEIKLMKTIPNILLILILFIPSIFLFALLKIVRKREFKH
jgi:abequosyltransferase